MKFTPTFLNLAEEIDQIPFQGNYGNEDPRGK